jgi:Uma2 family endonuclease
LPHALVNAALVTSLSVALRGRNHRVPGLDLRIDVSKSGPFFYPDATVYCGEPQLADNFKDTLLNPNLVIDVLSQSSAAYDRSEKFAGYRKIDSLREYVLVSRSEAIIESYVRSTGRQHSQPENIAVEIALAEIYRDIESPISPKQ